MYTSSTVSHWIRRELLRDAHSPPRNRSQPWQSMRCETNRLGVESLTDLEPCFVFGDVQTGTVVGAQEKQKRSIEQVHLDNFSSDQIHIGSVMKIPERHAGTSDFPRTLPPCTPHGPEATSPQTFSPQCPLPASHSCPHAHAFIRAIVRV